MSTYTIIYLVYCFQYVNYIGKYYTLSEELECLLKKYNSLDFLGKHTVNTVLEMEYNRCSRLNNQDKSF